MLLKISPSLKFSLFFFGHKVLLLPYTFLSLKLPGLHGIFTKQVHKIMRLGYLVSPNQNQKEPT